MPCPECGSRNESGSPSCGSCGLLLLTSEKPRRRSEDLRGSSRRATDEPWTRCEFCKAEIEASAVRCRHCSEVVDETVQVETALQRRAAINYASWVAYSAGLLALFIIRPVGLIAIGAGLLLSIAYHAIPADVTRAEPGQSFLQRMFAALRGLLRLEGSSVRGFPTRRQLVLVGSPLVVVIAGFVVNFYLLQHPMNQVLRDNPAYRGMQINTRYAFWVNPGVVVYDLEGVSGMQSRLDVHTVFLEYAKRLRSRNVARVELRYRGDPRFSVEGAAFRRLGEEYANRNYAFALFEFPRTVGGRQDDAALDGREALMRFHDLWYADALLNSGGP